MPIQGLVSVVIPVYNGAAYIEQAIRSVLDQTHRDFEVVAVDDGSTDDSRRLLEAFLGPVRVLSQTNAGVTAARNAGIAATRGEFIGFLDQDDYWHPEKLARQVECFQADARVGLVHTGVAYLDEASGSFVDPQNPDAPPELMTGECFERLLLGNPICNSSVVIRRSVIDEVGPCDPRILGNTVQDYDLWLRAARTSRFDHAAGPLTVFRLHAAQGHRDRRGMLGEELKVLLRLRPESEWLERPEGRRRLAQLYDAMATAHMDAGAPLPARYWYGKALGAERSRRQLFRFAASCLPYGIVQAVREARERRRSEGPSTL